LYSSEIAGNIEGAIKTADVSSLQRDQVFADLLVFAQEGDLTQGTD
jgi:hypothetical protein